VFNILNIGQQTRFLA